MASYTDMFEILPRIQKLNFNVLGSCLHAMSSSDKTGPPKSTLLPPAQIFSRQSNSNVFAFYAFCKRAKF